MIEILYIIIHIILSILVFIAMINFNFKKELNWNYEKKKKSIWFFIIVATITAPIFIAGGIILKIIKYVRNNNK